MVVVEVETKVTDAKTGVMRSSRGSGEAAAFLEAAGTFSNQNRTLERGHEKVNET
jgi:hypothetical protein